MSRVYLGVHWRFDGLPRNAADNIGGVPLGLRAAKRVANRGLITPADSSPAPAFPAQRRPGGVEMTAQVVP